NGGTATSGCPGCSAHAGGYGAGGTGGGGSGGTVLIKYANTCTGCAVGSNVNISGGAGGSFVDGGTGYTGGIGGTGGAGRFLLIPFLPATTITTNPSVCSGATAGSLSYTATGSPDQ